MTLGSFLAKVGAEVAETRSSGDRYCPWSELHPNDVEEIWGSGKRPVRGRVPGKAAEGGDDRSCFSVPPIEAGCGVGDAVVGSGMGLVTVF